MLRLDSFTSEQLTRAEPHPARLKLKSPKGKSGGGGTLHLLLSWVKEAPKLSKAPDPPPASAQPNTAKKVQPPQGERRAYPKQGLQTLPEGDEEGHDAGHESDGDSDGDDSDGQDGHVDTQQANNAEDSSDGDGGGGGGGSGGGGGGRRRSTGAARSPSNRSFESGSGYQRSRYGANGDMAVLAAVRIGRLLQSFMCYTACALHIELTWSIFISAGQWSGPWYARQNALHSVVHCMPVLCCTTDPHRSAIRTA